MPSRPGKGIYETARTAAQALRDPAIMAWVTPDPHLPALDPASFAGSTDTVYAMSKDGGGSAAPLVAALVDALFTAGTHRAEAAAGRLDPPLVAVLDEAANVARIGDLPQLYSHLGSRGLIPITILQSYRQGAGVWGDTGMDTLWSAATIKVIGAGIDDPKLAEDISKLIGEHDVTVRSTSHGRDHSTSHSLRRQRILPPEAIRALPRGQALRPGHRSPPRPDRPAALVPQPPRPPHHGRPTGRQPPHHRTRRTPPRRHPMTGDDTHDPARLLTALDQALADLQDMTDQRDALHAQLARTRPPRRARSPHRPDPTSTTSPPGSTPGCAPTSRFSSAHATAGAGNGGSTPPPCCTWARCTPTTPAHSPTPSSAWPTSSATASTTTAATCSPPTAPSPAATPTDTNPRPCCPRAPPTPRSGVTSWQPAAAPCGRIPVGTRPSMRLVGGQQNRTRTR